MLQRLANMFFSQHKEKIEEIPVEILHKARPQRKRKQYNEPDYQDHKKWPNKKESLHTTESIISEKVKKYLSKIFGASRLKAILEMSSSYSNRTSSVYVPRKESKTQKNNEDLEKNTKVYFPELPKYHKKPDKHFKTTKKLSSSFRKNLGQRKLMKANLESLNNLYNSDSFRGPSNETELKNRKIKFAEKREELPLEISKNVLKNLKSNSFCEIVDQLIKKQKKKQSRSTKNANKKLKKTTKSSISTMCARAKLLLHDSFVEEPDELDSIINDSPEDNEEIITIHNLNNYAYIKSSDESVKIIKSKSFDNVIKFYTKCSTNKISSCMNLHHSSILEKPAFWPDFEADLEVWTADYINGLVAVDDVKKTSKIPIKKTNKSVKTKSKKSIKSDVNNDVKNLTDSHLLGGVRTMEGYPDRAQKNSRKPAETAHHQHQTQAQTRTQTQKPKSKSKKSDLFVCQKVQDIQNYINNLIPPDEHKKPKNLRGACAPKTSPICPENQSIQELKKFQRELKMRIKELEKKLPTTSSALSKHKNTKSASEHDLSFLNLSLSNILDEANDNKPKVVNKVRYCTKRNSFNLKMKFGDKFCECCFLDAKKTPNDICRRCNKKVYLVERICAGEGVYHTFCYTCFYCRRNLNSLNLCVTRGEIFCKQCFKKYFGPEMYGFVK